LRIRRLRRMVAGRQTAQRQPASKPRVLVIDDVPISRMLRRTLARAHVETARTGEEDCGGLANCIPGHHPGRDDAGMDDGGVRS